jgi:hypothetical protein
MDHRVDTVINSFIAVGTVAVAVLAIWGDWIRARVAPPKLVLDDHDFVGNLAVIRRKDQSDLKAIYYHLRVVNRRRWISVEDCVVLLCGVSRRGVDGSFYPLPMTVPAQFMWAPAEFTPTRVTVTKDQILDFGRITEGDTAFRPLLYWQSNSFEGIVEKNQVLRYHLEIRGKNFVSPHYQVFEVSWDGGWSHVPAEMSAKHLHISEVTAAHSS